MKIDWKDVDSHWRMLNFLDHRNAGALFTGNLEFDENVFAGGVTQHQADVATRDLKRLGLILAAVDDRRNNPTRFEFANGRAASRFPTLRRQFYLFSHI